MSRAYTLFHMSKTGDYLVEVKQYKYLGYACKWAASHPGAKVYMKVNATGLPATWHKWESLRWRRLNAELVELLFTVLDSGKGESCNA